MDSLDLYRKVSKKKRRFLFTLIIDFIFQSHGEALGTSVVQTVSVTPFQVQSLKKSC